MKKKDIETQILSFLSQSKSAKKLNEISKHLKIESNSDEYDEMKQAIRGLCDKDLLKKNSRNRYSISEENHSGIIDGTIRINRGRGYIETKNKLFGKITIKRRNLFTALDGDEVRVKILALKKEKKPFGEVLKVLKRANAIITGKLEFDGSFTFLSPEDERYYIDFLVHKKHLHGAKVGDKVAARFVSWEDPQKSPQVEVIRILGKAGSLAAEFDSVLSEFSLPKSFPNEVLEETKDIPTTVSPSLIKKRRDLRKAITITIDPEDAKDFDDALSLEILENGNFLLGVHIADLSYFIPENSLLDKEAALRGNSVYLVDRAIPMLPEKLSSEVCSLKPNRVRLTFSVNMEFNPNGTLKDYEIYESVIKNKRRYNYLEIQEIIESGAGDNAELILNLHKLAQTLRKRRFAKAGVDFDSFEVKFELDSNKVPVKALLKRSNAATQLVEECMLAANKVIAEHIRVFSKQHKQKKLLPFLYRVHEYPNQVKLKEALDFLLLYGKKGKEKMNSSKALNQFIKQFEGQPEKPLVNQLLLRAMAKAEYSPENISHYGLGFKDYTHFTSPIRRYPDLIVHRLVKLYMNAELKKKRISAIEKRLYVYAEHCNEQERISMEAERASVKLAQVFLAKEHIGGIFKGTISGVTNFGVFVFLDDLFVEGLLHIKDLVDDFYIFDEKNFRLIGRNHKKIFYFGKRIKVKIVNANVFKRLLDLKYEE
ncbi:MAG: ribonuclease R [Ignavibacteria bacterium]|nr:ribonuclease R [Ignavibacteria bacterium]